MDWIIAFCLLFFMHYIMAATVNIVGKVNEVLSNAVHIGSGLDLMAEHGGVEYNRKWRRRNRVKFGSYKLGNIL